MLFLKKRCEYCGVKINKDKEILIKVKVPEFVDEILRPFCSLEHGEFYKIYIKGTPCKSCNLR